MAAKEDLHVGLEVVVYIAYSGRIQSGWVSRIARKYVTISNQPNWSPGMGKEFDIETQIARGEERSGAASVFRTLEQQEVRDRDKAARDALKGMGISVTYGGPGVKGVPSTEELEAIVDLLRRMRGAEGTSLPG